MDLVNKIKETEIIFSSLFIEIKKKRKMKRILFLGVLGGIECYLHKQLNELLGWTFLMLIL